ncbi:MAG: hypothetical protein J0H52_14880 [Comamonadaceae bacterium]|nr:hypothetical protein [Comamonadaceae bacterium]OJX20674.1 MAG: hypothetical protein BGO75_17110 [Burkholderiales bacterium 68-20]
MKTRLRAGCTTAAIALGLASPWCMAANPADCPRLVREFALLAHMGMEAEGVAAYRELRLHKDCAAALPASAADASLLPASSDVPQVMALGRQLHSQARDASARQAGKALSEGQIPQASAEALRGLGPDNVARALGAMVLDVAAAGLESRQRMQQAHSVRKAANEVRGDEPAWTGARAGQRAGAGTDAGPAPRQPRIALDADAVGAASCSGTYGFLAPSMRPYAAASLASLRQEGLNASIPEMLAGARAQAGTKAQALRLLGEQLVEYDRAANEAAQTANQTDGSSNSASIARASSDTLELGYPCDNGPSIHASAVCAYVAYRWGSLVTRASIALVERCWEP